MNDTWDIENAESMSNFTDQQVKDFLADYAKQAWENAYIVIDYSKITADQFRVAAKIRTVELKLIDADE